VLEAFLQYGDRFHGINKIAYTFSCLEILSLPHTLRAPDLISLYLKKRFLSRGGRGTCKSPKIDINIEVYLEQNFALLKKGG